MGKIINISGEKYGRLTVIEYDYTNSKNGRFKWVCKCECGNIKSIDGHSLRKGLTKSCGCIKIEQNKALNTKHGEANKSGEYRAWKAIKKRCYWQKYENYHNYGGRGIIVCERWLHSFDNFLNDMGRRPSNKHSLDRIDTNGNYEPNNCRWATQKEQMSNTRKNVLIEYKGEIKTRSEWGRYLQAHNLDRQLKVKTFEEVYNFYMNKKAKKCQ